MTKSTITRERLEWLSQISCRDDIEDIGGDEIRELASMALATMDSEPVAWRWRWSDDAEGYWRYTEEQRETRGSVTAQPLYRHAQQPVVPETAHSSVIAEQLANVLSDMKVTDHQRAVINCAVDRLNNVAQLLQLSPSALLVPEILDYQGAKELYNYLMTEEETNATVNAWNACRAAMLNHPSSIQPNTDAAPGTEIKHPSSNSPVIPDGYVMVPKEPTAEMQSAGASAIRIETTALNKLWTGNAVFRAMLAAAPQEVKGE